MASTPPDTSIHDLINAIQNRDATLLDTTLSTKKESVVHFYTKTKGALENQIQQHWHNEQILNDEKKLNAIVEVIRVLRKHNICIDLSVLPNPSLSMIIKQLFLQKPSDADWILSNMNHSLPIQFPFLTWDFLKTEIHTFDTKENSAMYRCLSRFNLNGEEIIDNYMHADSKHAISLALQLKMSLETLYQKLLANDSPHCLEEFIQYVENPHAYFKSLSLNEAEVKGQDEYLQSFNSTDPSKMLAQAVNANAPRSIAILLKRLNISTTTLETLIQQAALDNNLVIVLALCQNDFNRAANAMFKDDLFLKVNQTELDKNLVAILRFTPVDVVETIVNAYVIGNDKNKNALLQSYSTEKHKFFQYAPAFARYTEPSAFAALGRMYGRYTPKGFKEKAERDMEYGQGRSALVAVLAHEMESETAANTFIPTRPELLSLPSASNGSRTFAALLEKIADYNTRKNDNDLIFYELNQPQKKTFRTPVASQYKWAKPLISAVFHHSQSKQVLKYPDQENNALYSLTYKGSIINHVESIVEDYEQFYMTWQHGRLPLKDTIEDIENLLNTMKKQPLTTVPDPKETGNETKENKEQLTQFYANATKLVWLIGNTQPLKRGSGSVAELTLMAIFKFRGLQAPILKIEFPQLDVLDITFPLDDYIKLFPYFCESSSLPKHLRKPSLSHLSVNEQIKSYYNEINGIPLIAPSPVESLSAKEHEKRSGRKPPPPPASPQTDTSTAATTVMAVQPVIITEETRAAPTEQLLSNPKPDAPSLVTLSTSAQDLRSGRKPPPPPLPGEPPKTSPSSQ